MTGTLTLTITGADTGPFDIYQDTDNFSTAIETNVSKASLEAGASITLDTAAKTVRVVSTGGCLNYKDIDINFGQDTSPSITVATDANLATIQPLSTTLVGDGKNFLWGTVNNDRLIYSTDNGTNWSIYQDTGINEYRYPIHDQSTGWYINNTSTDVFEVTPENIPSGISVHHSTDIVLGSGESFRNYFWYNNYYYISTDFRLLRSSDNVNFDAILSYPEGRGWTYTNQNQLVGYGSTLYHSSPRGNDLYKSIDNGKNWTPILENQSERQFMNLYVENANNIMYAGATSDGLYWTFSTNGGDTWANSWMRPAQYRQTADNSQSAGVYKYNDIYYYTDYSGQDDTADLLSYAADTPFSSSGTKIGTIPSVYIGKDSSRLNSLACMHFNRGRLHLAGNLTSTATSAVQNMIRAITIDIENTL